ncbi:hypothetical protein [Geodermatophilus sp. SYSU D01176]
MTEPDLAALRPMGAHPGRAVSRRSDGRPRAGRLSAGAALLGTGAVVLAAHDLPAPGHIGSSAVTTPPGAGTVTLAVLAVVLLLAARSIRHRPAAGPLVTLAASSAVGYLAVGAALGPDRAGPTDDVAETRPLALAVAFLAAVMAVTSWRALPAGSVTLERRTRVLVGVLLLTAVWGLLLARHLTVRVPAEGIPVRSADALADLVVLPAATAAGAALLARVAWAAAAAFASSGCLAVVGLVALVEAWSRSTGTPAGTPWSVTALAVTAAVPAALCWTAVVRTGRQFWRELPATPAVPVPAPRPRLLPVPRSSLDDSVPVPAPTSTSTSTVERRARRSGT